MALVEGSDRPMGRRETSMMRKMRAMSSPAVSKKGNPAAHPALSQKSLKVQGLHSLRNAVDASDRMTARYS